MNNRVIWTCWFQGFGRAPELVQRSVTSWWLRNPNWEVRCLDAETVRHYVDIDAHIDLSKQQLTAASLSDVIRLLLLHEYGGVWVDATTVCNRGLDDWLMPAAAQGFFAFDRPAPDRPIASWFLASQAGNPLLAKWTTKALKYWRDRERSDDYFWVHHLFGQLLDEDPAARLDWARTPKLSADGPHSIQ